MYILLPDGTVNALSSPNSDKWGESVAFLVDEIESNGERLFALIYQHAGEHVELAKWDSPDQAHYALSVVRKALVGNPILKWSVRLFLVWLAWLFVTSYLQVRDQGTAATGLAQNLEPSTAPSPFVPPASSPLQEFPSASANGGNVSDYIYQQAMAAKDKAEHDDLPPKSGPDAAGLQGFGLSSDGQTSQSGSGCDPKLSFKVPQ